MNHNIDFCILGAGLAGLSFADALQEHNLSSVIIDKSTVAAGASGTPGGLVNVATGRRGKKSWKAEACYEAISENLEKIQSHTKKKFYLNNGLLRPALLKKMARKMKEQYEATSWPTDWCQWKAESEIKEIHPGITCVNGGLWLPVGLSVDVATYLHSYSEYLRNSGVDFFLNEQPVVKQNGNYWKIVSKEATLQANDLIFATGHSTKTSYWWDWLPISLIKGQVAKFKSVNGALNFSHSISSLGYMARTGETDSFIQGSTYEHNFDHIKPDAEGVNYLRKRMRRTLPELENKMCAVKQWAGVRVSTPNRKPILGRHPMHKNLHIFTGLGSKGLLYSKFLAHHYVEHLYREKPLFSEVDIQRFN